MVRLSSNLSRCDVTHNLIVYTNEIELEECCRLQTVDHKRLDETCLKYGQGWRYLLLLMKCDEIKLLAIEAVVENSLPIGQRC